MSTSKFDQISVERKGLILRPEGHDEEMGVMNPTTYRDPDGKEVLLYRAVSPLRKGVARSSALKIAVRNGDDLFTRHSIALEPNAVYECNGRNGGEGCEDARVVWMRLLRLYVMAYTAYGPLGPRVAMATSPDGYIWKRLGGLVTFPNHPHLAVMDNKNSCMLPEPVMSPSGRLSFAFLHRPRAPMAPDGLNDVQALLKLAPEDRPGIWMAYVPVERVFTDIKALLTVEETMQIVTPDQVPWRTNEQIQIGGGTQLLPIAGGHLLMLYHGVFVNTENGILKETGRYDLCHWGGLAVLDGRRPHRLIAMGQKPVLKPETADEIGTGRYRNIAFPTALERISPTRLTMYYGAADTLVLSAEITAVEPIFAEPTQA